MTLKAVFFDMDDTLVLTSQCDALAYAKVEAEARRACGDLLDGPQLIADFRSAVKACPWDEAYPDERVPVEEHRAGLWTSALRRQLARAHVLERDGSPEVNEAALRALGARLQAIFNTERLATFTLVEGAAELVARLHERGLATVVITNGHHQVQHAKIDAGHVAEVFGAEHILVGGDEVCAGRQEKPHPGIFHKACSIAGCEPLEVVMVGDNYRVDMAGAASAGLAAGIWVNPKGRELQRGPTFPITQVNLVTEVEDGLARLGFM
mmetsp:Transcript_73798/g.130909  ORF Transcript_73798/g.130909 Transcript_73798/m.130909 type:complete len:266 (-) Transcript_73798:36-833(-)